MFDSPKKLALASIFIAVVGVAIYFVYASTAANVKEPVLPFYGPRGENGDPHFVFNFKLTDQDNKEITLDQYKGKIYVADFFFTTCQGICPIMTEGMIKVYRTYDNNPDILFLSHTVDPEHDTSEVLHRYAENRDIKSAKWHFVTGAKKDIYDLARYSYLVDATEGDAGPNDFVHTENFALVDREGRIRGYYDGTDSVEVNKLILDISALLTEEK
ncbi:MAG: SCO family protein [Chitinophagales bacterium]